MAYLFPITWGITILRRLAISDALFFSSDVTGLASQAVTMFVAGGFVFFACLKKAKVQGLLVAH